ncbi:MAG: TolC family protein, partial [Verrucomicrobia bacterium]|nr:TolC family protein [Verrucomicrobiota bacterium]
MVGPDYQRPAAVSDLPPAYNQVASVWKPAQPRAALPKGDWWELFGDPDLDRLETNAAVANQDFQAVAARFEQARALVNVARSGLLPQLELPAVASRERDSANRPFGGKRAPGPATYNTFTVPLDLSYEVDLWGRVRRGVEEATAQLQSSADDVQSVKLAVAAEVALDYLSLRELDAEADLLTSTVEV